MSLVVIDAPATGQPTIFRCGAGEQDADGGGGLHRGSEWAADEPHVHLPVGAGGRLHRHRHPRGASETYTLTASDLGKQIKMKVRFTDFRGHAEGPLTSNAYPPNNGTVVAAVGPCPAVNDWCATMTAAVDRDAVGYDYEKFGSLDDDQIEYRGQNINVWTVHTQKELTNEYFYFGSMPRVPRGTVVTVGEHTFTTDMESEDGSAADIWEFPSASCPPTWSGRTAWTSGSVSCWGARHLPSRSRTQAPPRTPATSCSRSTLSRAFAEHGEGRLRDYFGRHRHRRRRLLGARLHPRHSGGETTVQMGFALIEDTVDDAGETVMVRLSNARLINKRGKKKADLDITTAEATGTITAPPASTTNVPGLTIGIRDATGDEDNGGSFSKSGSRRSMTTMCVTTSRPSRAAPPRKE